jgi:hypothetical protein
MKVSLSPWAAERLGREAVEALKAGPDQYQLSISRGQSGWGATLIERTLIGYHELANTSGHAEPEQAIAAVMEIARPKPREVA